MVNAWKKIEKSAFLHFVSPVKFYSFYFFGDIVFYSHVGDLNIENPTKFIKIRLSESWKNVISRKTRQAFSLFI